MKWWPPSDQTGYLYPCPALLNASEGKIEGVCEVFTNSRSPNGTSGKNRNRLVPKNFLVGWRKTIDYIMNPSGWLYDCYKDAILIYKQTRYAKSAEEHEQREKELIEKATLTSRMKPYDAV
jgi:hypothetical protein